MPSVIWKHFRKIDSKKAQCKRCLKHYTLCGNTTNFWIHLEKQHGITKDRKIQSATDLIIDVDDPEPLQDMTKFLQHQKNAQPNALTSRRKISENSSSSDIKSPKQSLLSESIKRMKSFKDGGTRSAQLKDALLYMICKDRLPLSTPEKKGFQFMFKKAVPLWIPPSRATITKMMEDKYNVLSELVKNEIANMEFICLTCDCWMEKHTTTAYLGVTIHFLRNTNMESAVLGVTQLSESHTSVYLAEQISSFCEKWNINVENVGIVVTDNAENIKQAVKAMFGNDKCIPCFDHTLNLIPKAALSKKIFYNIETEDENILDISDIMEKVKLIVSFSHKSYNFSDMLKKIQMQQGKSKGTVLHLLQDVITRWSSSFFMLERFLELSDIVSQVILSFPSLTMLTGAELATARTISSILQPFAIVTKEMSAEHSTTASKVIPIVQILREKINHIEVPECDQRAERFKQFILSELNRRFNNIEKILPIAIATILDPRFKKIYFNDAVALCSALNRISHEMKQLICIKANAAAAFVIQNETEYTAAQKNPKDIWDIHEAKKVRSVTSTIDAMSEDFPAELRQYLNKPIESIIVNLFEAWESMKVEFPFLYLLARRYLSIIATSVPAERLFSEAGLIATDKRNRLTGEHLSQLIFLSSVSENLWNTATSKM